MAPEGRKLLRLEVRNAETPIERKPPWIRTRARTGPQYTELKSLVRSGGLHTVCEEAGCPNIYECWEDREATFLIGGEQCTRRCDFCQIDTGKPAELDRDEPRRVAESVRTMGLRYSTVTGVARDDLPDGGAWLYAETVRQIHELNPGTGVELLIPDFNSIDDQLGEVFDTRPEVLAHNLETVPRIFKRIRPAFRYDRSLAVLTKARAAGLVTKSNLILGMGETPDEVTAALADLHEAGCEIITITQYLRPTPRHHPVERWVKPEEFVEHAKAAEEMGFAGVMAGPLVRSSYRAGRLYAQTKQRRGEALPEGLEHLADGGAAAQEAASSSPARAILTGMAGKPAKADKEAQKAAKREKRAASRMRYKQLWQAFQHQRREDKLLLPLMIGCDRPRRPRWRSASGCSSGCSGCSCRSASPSASWPPCRSSDGACRAPSTPRPTASRAPRGGRWTTCAGPGGSARASRAPPTSTPCTG